MSGRHNGYLAAKDKLINCQKERYLKAVEAYNKNPNYCKNCKNKIKLEKGKKIQSVKRKQFCNHSCASIFNNRNRERNTNLQIV